MSYLRLLLEQHIKLVCAAMLLSSFLSSPTLAQTQAEKPASVQPKPTNQQPVAKQQVATSQFIPPPPPADIGAPGQREGAASRGACPRMNKPLTALVPAIEKTTNKNGIKVESVWSLTVAERPTFWFYVPYSPSSLRSVEFVLQDENDNDIYRTPAQLPEIPGIISLRLPSSLQPLEIGKRYHWFLKMSCTAQNASSSVFVEGWVQRVAPNSSLMSQLEKAAPQQAIALYTANGIWQDALTSLGELRLTHPKDTALKAKWNDLLQSVGLAEITSQPLVPCCSLQ